MIGSKPTYADTDWFRCSRWSQQNRATYLGKITKARDAAQRAAIQASYLVVSDHASDWAGALEALAAAGEVPDTHAEAAFFYMCRAQAHEELGALGLAVADYHRSLGAMGVRRTMICNTAYFLARCVAENAISDAFDATLGALDANPALRDGQHLSAGNHFADLGARALIAAARGQAGASALAEQAFTVLGFEPKQAASVATMSRRSAGMIRRVAAVLDPAHPIALAVLA